ncbi:hypothetical protein [Sabulibacter ruber]|uniref:hypothetical protein n=1 Tax=Sabulibacter ruber TaxID=2811901 RepID=UPI001A95FCEB|nr:hypothetical protein [Sabulibacter ruber]
MRLLEIKNNEAVFRTLLQRAILDAAEAVVDRSHKAGKMPREEDFVAGLTLVFTPNLFHVLKAVFPRNQFSLTGIYSFLKPTVNIKLRREPELGDLLLVFLSTDKTGAKRGNSLLLKARKSRKMSLVLPKAELHQVKLYSEWPAFTRQGEPGSGEVRRDILPKAIHDGAQYLLIDDNPFSGLSGLAGTFPLGCAIPSPELCLNNDLAAELVDFFKFKAGRTFEPDPSSSRDDWTRLVWDLLDQAKAKASRRRNSAVRSFRRTASKQLDGGCFFVPEPRSIYSGLHAELGDGKPANLPGKPRQEDTAAVSVIVVESFEQAEEG